MGLNPGFPRKINPPIFMLCLHSAAARCDQQRQGHGSGSHSFQNARDKGLIGGSFPRVWRGMLHGSALVDR
jgi:hypothetical protein